MKRSEFVAYKNRFVEMTRMVLASESSDALSEAAFPAYTNPNPVASYVFWARIRIAIEFLGRRAPLGSVLDFGCGGGVMLPFLGRVSDHVVAADTDLSPLEKLWSHGEFPAGLETLNTSKSGLGTLVPASFDVVTALDVLEHVENLLETVSALSGLLKPGGLLLVSGPTENLFYKIGRAISGKAYTGQFHVRNVYQIREVMARYLTVRTLATLFYPVPLFKIYVGVLPG